jgi:hypothetical protein
MPATVEIKAIVYREEKKSQWNQHYRGCDDIDLYPSYTGN